MIRSDTTALLIPAASASEGKPQSHERSPSSEAGLDRSGFEGGGGGGGAPPPPGTGGRRAGRVPRPHVETKPTPRPSPVTNVTAEGSGGPSCTSTGCASIGSGDGEKAGVAYRMKDGSIVYVPEGRP